MEGRHVDRNIKIKLRNVKHRIKTTFYNKRFKNYILHCVLQNSDITVQNTEIIAEKLYVLQREHC